MITSFATYRFLAFLGVVAILSGCGSKTRIEHPAGVAISFDDHFIEEWHQLLPLFEKHKARATFFLTCPDTFSSRETTWLRQLEAQGHEIGFHGTIHAGARQLVKSSGVSGYLNAEITPGLRFLKRAGFSPTTYAHPGGNRSRQTDSVLLAQKFILLRDVALSRRHLVGIPLYHIPPQFIPSIFYTDSDSPTVQALLMDTSAQLSRSEIRDALLVAQKTGTVLMLFGHKPLYHPPQTGEYGFEVDFLKYILQQADSLGLHFYTMSELPSRTPQRP